MGSIIGIHQKIDLNIFNFPKIKSFKNISTNAYSTREKMVALNPLMRLA